MIRDALYKISTEFSHALDDPYVGHPLANYIRNIGPKLIQEKLPSRFKSYTLKGSAGQDDWANIRGAWIGIFNPEITTGASKGYYLVYGFPVGSTQFVFGLSQGYYEAEKKYKKDWENVLETHANLMQLIIPSDYSKTFKTGKPEFSLADGTKGYRTGYAYHKVYDSLNLPEEEELENDLINMLNAYEAVYLNGGRNLDIKFDKPKKGSKTFEGDEDAYQNPPKKKNLRKSPKSAEITDQERSSIKNSSTNIRPRNSDYGEEAKQNVNYQCEISASHQTFLRQSDGNPYTEAHHLIPYEQYDTYTDKNLCLDRISNIVSLCPNCHRQIHHGTKDDISNLLDQLFENRGDVLINQYGCDLETLKEYYKI